MNILVLDDNYAIGIALQSVLEQLGPHTVRTLTRPDDVVEELRDFRPDAFVFDFLLPVKSLAEVVRDVRSALGLPEDADFPFVIFSLYADDDFKREEMVTLCRGEAQRVIQKGNDLIACARRIVEVLSSRAERE